MRNQIILVLLLQSLMSQAQQISPCLRNFEESYRKIERNYAGWSDKITPKNQVKFDELTASTRTAAAEITEADQCYFLMNKWLSFFEDGHLFINIENPYVKPEPKADLVKRANKVAVEKWSGEQAFKKSLDSNPFKNDIEGVWVSEDGAYKVGIVKTNKRKKKFTAYLLEGKDELWKLGREKFELKETSPGKFDTDYLYADFTKLETFSRQVKDFLVIDQVYKFQKVYPQNMEKVTNEDLISRIPKYRVEKISNNTVLMTLPPFTQLDAADVVQEMVSKNRNLLVSSENLIIDLRNNPGGDENALAPLYPYISDKQPIVRKGGIFRSTEENVVLLNHELESVREFPKYRRLLEPKLTKVISEMKNNIGSDIQGPDKVFQYISDMQNPKKVAILVNEYTASTAESVVLEAKQSSKTIVIGQKTKGLADYIEVRDWGLPHFGWRLAFGIAKSSRLPDNPIDNKGITPDVKVPKREADWVGFTQKYLNR